jgi:hypothetical protein
LLDSEILAGVYLELMGGKQNTINLEQNVSKKLVEETPIQQNVVNLKARNFKVSDDELNKHKEFLKTLPNSLWSGTSES